MLQGCHGAFLCDGVARVRRMARQSCLLHLITIIWCSQHLLIECETTEPITEYHKVTDPALLNTLSLPVQEVWSASTTYPGFEEVSSDSQLEELYRDSLSVDLQPWKQRSLTMKDFDKMMTQLPENDVQRIVLLKGNKIYYPMQHTQPMFRKSSPRQCAEPCNQLIKHWEATMLSFMEKEQFPDCIFHLNVNDWPKCKIPNQQPHHRLTGPCVEDCAAPVLSFQKSKEFEDILIPLLSDSNHPLYIFPWEHKVDKAFMRATAFCAQGDSRQHYAQCARTYFTRLALYHNKSHILEAGLTTGFGVQVSGNPGETDPDAVADGPLPPLGFFPFKDHARYKFLLDTDGMTASYRASKLMHINSAILKQRTPYFEYWGRSVKDYVHHIPFWDVGKDDIFDVLEKYRHNETFLKDLAMNAMRFAYKYTSEKARLIYLLKALNEYKALFPDMDEYIANVKLPIPATKNNAQHALGRGAERHH